MEKTTITLSKELRQILNQMKYDRKFKTIEKLLWSLVKEESNSAKPQIQPQLNNQEEQ